jgi:hypothetical protein
MSEIQDARDVLAKWREASDRLRPLPWSFHVGWGADQVMDGDGGSINHEDQDDAAQFNGPVAALIVGTAGNPDLLDAIDALLATGITLGDRFAPKTHAAHVAAAIIAADERMRS